MSEYKIPLKDGKVDYLSIAGDLMVFEEWKLLEPIAVLQALYNHALEEAAKVADSEPSFGSTTFIARTIRALKEGEE